MPKKDKIGLIRSYIELFMNNDIKTGKLLYHNSEIVDIIYSANDSIFGDSISIKNKKGETRRISMVDLVKSKQFNFRDLFLKNYKYYYEDTDIGYNKVIDNLLEEIQKE